MPDDPSTDVVFVRHAGRGPLHVVCLPGLVPDGPEAFMRQLGLLRRHGTVAVASWPTRRFDLERVIAAVGGELRAGLRAGRTPVLLAMSFGGGVALEMLARDQARGAPPILGGLALISPLPSTADLSAGLKRLLRPIETAVDAGGDVVAALERGRAFFHGLALRAVGEPADGGGWLGPMRALTPAGFAARRDRAIRDRILDGLNAIPAAGAVERVMAMRALRGLPAAPLGDFPALVLWGSKERHTLDMDGPCTGRLCRPDLAVRVLPGAEVHWVYDADGSPVPHASTLRHAAAFNRHLVRFLARIARAAHQHRSVAGSLVSSLHALLPGQAAAV